MFLLDTLIVKQHMVNTIKLRTLHVDKIWGIWDGWALDMLLDRTKDRSFRAKVFYDNCIFDNFIIWLYKKATLRLVFIV